MVNATTQARRQQALELRLAGANYRQIAERLGISLRAAWRHGQIALAQSMQEPAQEVREIEVMRLDRLLMAHWPRAITGDVDATDRVLKIMDRRAKLLGLDQMPVEPGLIDDLARELNLPAEEIRAEARRLGGKRLRAIP